MITIMKLYTGMGNDFRLLWKSFAFLLEDSASIFYPIPFYNVSWWLVEAQWNRAILSSLLCKKNKAYPCTYKMFSNTQQTPPVSCWAGANSRCTGGESQYLFLFQIKRHTLAVANENHIKTSSTRGIQEGEWFGTFSLVWSSVQPPFTGTEKVKPAAGTARPKSSGGGGFSV